MKIKALARIEVGQTFLSKHLSAKKGNICLIEPRLMEMGIINYTDAKQVQYSGKKILQHGDVLFVNRGKFEAAVFESDAPSVATNAFFVLRPNDQIKSGYLSAFLNSYPAQQYFRRKQKQTTAKFISKEDILELEIPLPPLRKQEELIQATDLLRQTEQLLSQKAQILKKIREGLFSHLQGE